MSEGYIKLSRRLLKHPLWTGSRFTNGQAWVDLLLAAGYANRSVMSGSTIIDVKRGEILTSQAELAARWRWNRRTVRRFLSGLEVLGMIRIRSSKGTESGYTLVSIINWDTYQLDGKSPHSCNVASEGPSEGPSGAHPVHIVNKGKKGKNVTEPVNGSAHREILEHYHQLFKAKFGTAPLIVGGRDGKIVSSLIQARKDSKEINMLLDLFFRIGTKYARETGRYDLPSFKASYNELLVLSTQGMS